MTHNQRSRTEYLAPVPYYVVPAAQLAALVREHTELGRDLDSVPWAERANRQARLAEIERTLAVDARGREEQRRAAPIETAAHACGRGPGPATVAELRNAIAAIQQATRTSGAEIAELQRDVVAVRERLARAGFVVQRPREPTTCAPLFLPPKPYWTERA